MKGNIIQLNINTKQTILSSNSLFFKTENFCKKTKYLSHLDILLSKIAETIIKNINEIMLNEKLSINDCFYIQTNDNYFGFIFKVGCQLGEGYNKFDIIFFDYVIPKNQNLDIRIDEYVKQNQTIKIIITKKFENFSPADFNKLYLISNVSGVNLPRLSKEQQEIVTTVDKNVLVQGVAGSGKTNICIDKIIFTACKNYSGKVLYTTFSRGLLVDTKLKVELFKKDLEQILNAYQLGDLIFLDNNHKRALENKLGIYFFSDDDTEIFRKLERIIDYLTNSVDYLLIEDMYKAKTLRSATFVGQDYFINNYSVKPDNHQIIMCFNKLSKYSKEIIYKEIYGMIFGSFDLENKQEIISLDDYILARENSFSKAECEIIYQIALDYRKHCEKRNLIDNNFASKILIDLIKNKTFDYSLSIIDEVQDYTQANLCLFKMISLKMFCVGDALQMINPSYFSFSYLKNLMYEQDVTDVKVLQFNYRNSAKISEIINSLNEINKKEFGTHNFVVQGKSVDSQIDSKTIFVKGVDFAKNVSISGFDNFTFVVSSDQDKKSLSKIITNQEILTISEIKGLERDTVVAFNLLSSSKDKWQALEHHKVNHKLADENSVYRYYYNLFYVGLSRARQNLFVVEDYNVKQFDEFFNNNFEILDTKSSIKVLGEIVRKVDFSQNQVLDRVNEFIRLEQWGNARFNANKIMDNSKRIDALRTIDVYENYIHYGKYREAGVKFWEYGLLDDAKKQFTLSGDNVLIDLIDRCSKNSHSDLSIDIINYFEDVKDNKIAQQFIIETIKKDVEHLKTSFNNIKENFKKKDKNFGK